MTNGDYNDTMKKTFKKIKLICAVFILPVLLSGCLNSVELNERAIVQAMGIDLEGDMFIVTLQTFDPKGGGSSTAVDASKVNSKTITAQGMTITEAFSNAALNQGKEIFYGHNKLLVIGKEAAEKGIWPIANFLNSHYDFRPNVDMAISTTKASDIVAAEMEDGILPAISIQTMLMNAEENGRLYRGYFFDVIKAMEEENSSACIPLLEISGEGKEKSVGAVGTAVLKSDKYDTELDEDATKALLIIKDMVSLSSISVDCPDIGRVALNINNCDTQIKTQTSGDKIKFTISVDIDSSINEARDEDRRGIGADDINTIEASQNEVVEKIITNTIKKACIEKDTDPFGFNRYCRFYEKDFYEKNKENWNETLKNADFEVVCKSTVQNVGLQKK